MSRAFKFLADRERTVLLFIICAVFMAAVFPAVNGQYLTEGQHGHVELQRTNDKAKYGAIIGSWETSTATLAEAVRYYRIFLGLDCLFAVFYVLLWASLIALLTNIPGARRLSRWKLVLFFSPALAGIADIIENVFHLILVAGIQSAADLSALSEPLIRYSYVATVTKYGFLLGSLLPAVGYYLYTRLFTVGDRVGEREERPEYTRELGQVIEREDKYIAERRKQAGSDLEGVLDAEASKSGSKGTYKQLLEDKKRGTIGLTFSGGGIRSTSFNLGLVQGLSRFGLLSWVDYLTSVSGGGFAAACMTTLLSLRQRDPTSGRKTGPYFFNTQWARFPFNPQLKTFDEQGVALKQGVDGLAEYEESVPLARGENAQLAYLRKMSNYLAPRLGGVSRDVLRGLGAFLVGIIYTLFIFLTLLGAVSATHYLTNATMAPDVMGDNIQIVAESQDAEQTQGAEPLTLNLHVEDQVFVVDVPVSPPEPEEEQGAPGPAVDAAGLLPLIVGTDQGGASTSREWISSAPGYQYGWALGVGFALSLLICWLIATFYRKDPGRKYALDSWKSPIENVSIRTYVAISNIRTFAGFSFLALSALTGLLWSQQIPWLRGQNSAELADFFWMWLAVFGLFALLGLWFILEHLRDYTWVQRGLPDRERIDGLVVRTTAGLFVWVMALTIAWLRFTSLRQSTDDPQMFWVWLPSVFTIGSLIGLTLFRLIRMRFRIDVGETTSYTDRVGLLGRVYFRLLRITRKPSQEQDVHTSKPRRFDVSIWANPNYRSVFWTLQGLILAALLAFVISAVLILPHFFAVPESGASGPAIPAATALLSALWASLLAYFNGKADFEPKTWIEKIIALPAGMRNQVLGALIIVLNLSVIFIFETLIDTYAATPVTVLGIGGIALGLFWVSGRWINFNHLSPHYFFRDRAAETFMKTEVVAQTDRPRTSHEEQFHPGQVLPYQDEKAICAGQSSVVRNDGDMLLGWITPKKCSAPYHLVLAAMNMPGSWDLQYKDRKSQHFIFSKHYCGSDITGYVNTNRYRGRMTKYAEAIAISGAALASSLGYLTFFAQAFMMTLLNIRLGLWLPSPERYAPDAQPTDLDPRDYETRAFWPTYLWDEARGRISERRPLINVSDGGHTGDNAALYPLFQRRCRVIIAGDASQDPEGMCKDLFRVIRQVKMDMNIDVEIDVEGLQPAEYDKETKTGKPSKYHCAVGKITYPAINSAQGKLEEEKGWLIYFKPAVTADVPGPIKQYWETHPAQFPHPTTADQFFDEEQFEAQRSLGEVTVKRTLKALDDYYENLVDEAGKDQWTDDEVNAMKEKLGRRPALVKAILSGDMGAVLNAIPKKSEKVGEMIEEMVKELRQATTV